jgi:toxin HigB-1
MDISFANNHLKKCANSDSFARQKMGSVRARLYKQRLDEILASDSMEDLRHMPGRYHELTGDLKGKWACNLDQPYRIIMTPHEDPIPTDGRGCYIWAEIHGVAILEIKDYH